MIDWSYDAWPSGEPYDWTGAARGDSPFDAVDHHVDLGCGTVKKGRIGIDRYPAPGVNIVMDLDELVVEGLPRGPGLDAGYPPPLSDARGLPFPSNSIESMVSHHALEHIDSGFIPLMDECYRVLKPNAVFRIIVPLFPSTAAVEDPDHCRWFCEGTFEAFTGVPGVPHWCSAFSVPYTKSKFELLDKDMSPRTPPEQRWMPEDRREIRVALAARK